MSNNTPSQAYLIVNGAEVFVLKNKTTTIGRMFDNDLIINDNRVSRYHAQIYLEKSQYCLVDLNSTGGTSVNNKKVSKVILNAGDVISLAGVPVIFGTKADDKEPGSPEKNKEITQPSGSNVSNTDSQDLDNLDNYLNLFEE